MDAKTVAKMLADIPEGWREFLFSADMSAGITEVVMKLDTRMKSDKKSVKDLAPPPPLIFECFRQCDFYATNCVLIGQDPYVKPGEAMGLSFSVPVGVQIPPSLQAIYKSMQKCGVIKDIPPHGDLRSWARQGVLMLNSYLTTYLGVSAAHADIWESYTDLIIKKLSAARRGIRWILLGAKAAAKASLIAGGMDHRILTWGHPSPMNPANRRDCPANFINCNVWLELPNIVWDPTAPYSVRTEHDTEGALTACTTATLFTDGSARGVVAAARGDGVPRGAYAYLLYAVIDNSAKVYEGWGVIEQPATNNRAELYAVLYGLQHAVKAGITSIRVVSDSQYAIGCISEWGAKWQEAEKSDGVCDKKNTDIVYAAIKTIKDAGLLVKFHYTPSHVPAPDNKNSDEWCIWKGNDHVDRRAQLLVS